MEAFVDASLIPLSEAQVYAASGGALTTPDLHDESGAPSAGGPICPTIFRGGSWGHVELPASIHPWFLEDLATIFDLTHEDLWYVARGYDALALEVVSPTRSRLAVVSADASAAELQRNGVAPLGSGPSGIEEALRAVALPELAAARTDRGRVARWFLRTSSNAVLRAVPVPPPSLRGPVGTAGATTVTELLATLVKRIARLHRLKALSAPASVVRSEHVSIGEALDDWLTYAPVLIAREAGLLEEISEPLLSDVERFEERPEPTEEMAPAARSPRDPVLWQQRAAGSKRLVAYALERLRNDGGNHPVASSLARVAALGPFPPIDTVQA